MKKIFFIIFIVFINKGELNEIDLIKILKIFKHNVINMDNQLKQTLNLFTNYIKLPSSKILLPKNRYAYQIKLIKNDMLVNKHYTNIILDYFKLFVKNNKGYTQLAKLI